MHFDFTTISLAHEEDEVKIPKIVKRLPKKLYMNYLLKKLPINMTYFTCIGEKQQNIILPFIKGQLKEYEIEFIREYIQAIINKYNLIHVYSSDSLNKYFEIEKISYHNLLSYIVLDQIIANVIKTYNFEWRNLRLVVIDSEDGKMDYILEMIVKNLNYLLIITRRQEYFKEIKEMIYDNTGLVVETSDYPLREIIEGDLIIDAHQEGYRHYNFFKKNAVVIDLESNSTKTQYQYSRRKDLSIIYKLSLTARGEEVDNDLLGQLLCSKSWVCSNFIKNSCRSYRVQDLLELARYYKITIKELKILAKN